MNPDDAEAIAKKTKEYEKQIEIQKSQLSKLPKEQQVASKKQIAAEEELLNKTKALLVMSTPSKVMSATHPVFPKPGVGGAPGTADAAYAPGSALGYATSAAVGGKLGTSAKPKGAPGLGTAKEANVVTGSIEVKVNAVCVGCGAKDGPSHAVLPIHNEF